MSHRAKKVLDIVSIFLFCALLFSLSMVWYSVNELEKAETALSQVKAERAVSIDGRLNDMLQEMESRDERR